MADFAGWIVAAESALPWEAGAFIMASTGGIRQEDNAMTLEASPVAQAFRDFMARSARNMLERHGHRPAERAGGDHRRADAKRQKSWPASGPRAE